MSRQYRKMPPIQIGDRFTRLTVVSRSSKEGEPRWECLCGCGSVKTILERSLKNGHTRSCGCLHDERSVELGRSKRTHGHSVEVDGKQVLTPEYGAWRSLRRRILKEDNPSYKNYGGRGLTMEQAWLDSFESFYAEIGPKPTPAHTVERINNDLGYVSGNVRWATRLEQGRNKRNNLRITINGETRCLSEWGEVSGVRASTIQRRYHAGWTPEALLKPARKLNRRTHAVCK